MFCRALRWHIGSNQPQTSGAEENLRQTTHNSIMNALLSESLALVPGLKRASRGTDPNMGMTDGPSRVSWACPTLGSLSCLEQVKSPVPHVGADECLVAVRAIGLNYADVFCVLGLYEAANKVLEEDTSGSPFIPGLEFAGEVVSVGDNVKAHKPGDKVYGFSRFGSYTTSIVSRETLLKPMPAGWASPKRPPFSCRASPRGTAWSNWAPRKRALACWCIRPRAASMRCARDLREPGLLRRWRGRFGGQGALFARALPQLHAIGAWGGARLLEAARAGGRRVRRCARVAWRAVSDRSAGPHRPDGPHGSLWRNACLRRIAGRRDL